MQLRNMQSLKNVVNVLIRYAIQIKNLTSLESML